MSSILYDLIGRMSRLGGAGASPLVKAQSSNECFRADKLRLNGLFIAKGKARSLYVHIEISDTRSRVTLRYLTDTNWF